MPFTLHLEARPAPHLHTFAPRQDWQRLHQEADRAYPELRALWRILFTDLREAVDTRAMQEAIRSRNILEVESLLGPIMHQLNNEVRAPLRLLLQETAERSAEALLPSTETALDAELVVQFNVVIPASVQAIETYAGEQIVSISETTLRNVREVIRRGFTEGRSMTQIMRDLEFVGLTPRQTQAIETLRQRLLDAGVPRAQVQAQVDRAARRALQLRVENIARTESLWASIEGQEQLWREAERQGRLDPTRFRRTWIVTPDDRLCEEICAPIPGMNPEGVGLYDPFSTPAGAIQHPPAHPMCRCAVSGRVLFG